MRRKSLSLRKRFKSLYIKEMKIPEKKTKLGPLVIGPSGSYNKILRGYGRLWIHL
jgi:hypothetical protein